MKLIVTLFLLVAVTVANGQGNTKQVNSSDFYAAMSSKNLDSVNAVLNTIAQTSGVVRDAHEGVLLMKKAGLVSGPGKKLKLFKSGHKKLDSAIEKDSKNAEFRFFRLMIQENAPGILNYNDKIEEDSQIVQSGYKNLPQAAQKAIAAYAKTSKVLKPESL